MKIGLYGGTFDPVHTGHLILARDAIEELDLDCVIFIPASLSPHKQNTQPASASVRKEMLIAAIENEPRFVIDDCELYRKGPSFTIDTVLEIKARHDNAEVFYLVGEDNIRELHTWRRIQELEQLVQFVVLNRSDKSVAHLFPTLQRRIDISATEIRNRVAKGQSIRYLVPDKVMALIEHHHLYQDPKSSPPKN